MADAPNYKCAAPDNTDANKPRWQTTPQEQWDLANLFGCLCSRPKMFFRGGSFTEGAAYIDGFAVGRGGSVKRDLGDFNSWLAARAYKRDGTARNLGWDYYVKQLYPDDATAFAELPGLFEQFQKECQFSNQQ